MKKIVIAIIAVIIIIVGVYLATSKQNIDKILAKFDTYQNDGYYANQQNETNENNQEGAGYIVSNKTKEGYRYGYVNYKGEILLKAEYNQIYRVMDIEDKDKVYLIAAKDGRYGVTLNGKIVINYEYQFIEYHSNIQGFVLQKTDNYGVANINGEIILPVENEMVEVKGKYIYITNGEDNKVYDNAGNEKNIDFNISYNPTENEKYLIKIEEKGEQFLYSVTDKEENELIKAKYTYLEYLLGDYFVASNDNWNQGVIDNNNNIKLEFKFSLVQKIQNTNLIRTLNIERNQTEIYTNNFEKICVMENANIETEGNLIKVYNEIETKYFDKNGIEIIQ